MQKVEYNTYDFPECQSIIISGDIHGDFNLLVNKICVQYQMHDTLVIVAGDCGFGFERKGYYEEMTRHNAKRMNDANNWIVFIRGNHDNPAYFDGHSFKHKRFIAIPDYSVVKACNHSILCIGGAISIDRSYRKDSWQQREKQQQKFGHLPKKEELAPNYYWTNEAPIFNYELLYSIVMNETIDTVVTHSSPSFCELQNKNGLASWAAKDEQLIVDVKREREVLDSIHDMLKTQQQPISHWCYGHFHQSWHTSINGILFKMLDIMELYEIQ